MGLMAEEHVSPWDLGRSSPLVPNKKSKSKLVISLAISREFVSIRRAALVEQG